MLGDSSTRALRNDIFPPKKGHYVYSKRSFECNSTFRGMLSYTAIGNLPETCLHSSARALPDLQPGGYSLERGLAPYLWHGGWSGVGMGSWGGSHGARGRWSAGEPRAARPEPAALRWRGGGGRTERRQRKAIRDRQGRRLRRKQRKKGIEQLGFWKEGRRKNNRTVKDAPKGPVNVKTKLQEVLEKRLRFELHC